MTNVFFFCPCVFVLDSPPDACYSIVLRQVGILQTFKDIFETIYITGSCIGHSAQ